MSIEALVAQRMREAARDLAEFQADALFRHIGPVPAPPARFQRIRGIVRRVRRRVWHFCMPVVIVTRRRLEEAEEGGCCC